MIKSLAATTLVACVAIAAPAQQTETTPLPPIPAADGFRHFRTPAAQPQPRAAVAPSAPAPVSQSAVLSTPVGSASVDSGAKLNLVCYGGGSANKVDFATVYGSSNYSGSVHTSDGRSAYGSFGGSSTATVVGQRAQGFEDQVSLFVEGSEGRVRMPRTMLPVIRGGENGWFKLKSVQITSNEITASVAVNVLNNPKLRLDRYTGSISISGKAGDYAGQCRKIDPAAQVKAF